MLLLCGPAANLRAGARLGGLGAGVFGHAGFGSRQADTGLAGGGLDPEVRSECSHFPVPVLWP